MSKTLRIKKWIFYVIGVPLVYIGVGVWVYVGAIPQAWKEYRYHTKGTFSWKAAKRMYSWVYNYKEN